MQPLQFIGETSTLRQVLSLKEAGGGYRFRMDWKEEEENGLESTKGASLIIQNHRDKGGSKSVLTNSRQIVEEKLTRGTAWKVK